MRQVIPICIEVIVLELTLSNDLIGELSFEVHETLQHLIVGFSAEKNSAGVH
jgi:hypothetical protein